MSHSIMGLNLQVIEGGASTPLGYPYLLVSTVQSLTSAQQAQGRANLGISGTGGGGGGGGGVDDPTADVAFNSKSFSVSASNAVGLLSQGQIGLTSYGAEVYMRGETGITLEAANSGPIKLDGNVKINGTSLDAYIRSVIASYVSTSNIVTLANIMDHAVTSIQSKTGPIQVGSNLSMSGNVLNATGGSSGSVPANVITTDNIAKYAVTMIDEHRGALYTSGAFDWMEDPGAEGLWYGTLSFQNVQGDICVRNANGTLVLRNDASTGYQTRLAGDKVQIEFYDYGSEDALSVVRKDHEDGTMVPYVRGGAAGEYGPDSMYFGNGMGSTSMFFEAESMSASVTGSITGFA